MQKAFKKKYFFSTAKFSLMIVLGIASSLKFRVQNITAIDSTERLTFGRDKEAIDKGWVDFLIYKFIGIIKKWANPGLFLICFRYFLDPISIIQIEKSIDGLLWIRTLSRRMVGADDTTELTTLLDLLPYFTYYFT